MCATWNMFRVGNTWLLQTFRMASVGHVFLRGRL